MPALLIVGAALAGCGNSDPNATGDQFSNEQSGDYNARIVQAEFPKLQRVGETYDMVLGVRNTGDKTIPGLTITIDLPKEESTLAFAYRDDQVGLASAQRPVWIMAQGYPRLEGQPGQGGAGTSSRRTFNFGPLDAGEVATTDWNLSPVKDGNFKVTYTVAAGLSGKANAVGPDGEAPAGVFLTHITSRPQLTEVDDNGNVVPLGESEKKVDQGGG